VTVRGFPPPWTIEEHNDACFIGKDATGQALGYFYFGNDEPQRPAPGFTVSEPSMGGKWLMASQASAERRLLYPAS